MAQTVAINGNGDFLQLDDFMESLLQQKGFGRVERTGSTSWIDSRIQPADAAVRFKLCFFGPNRIVFGVRDEFLAECKLDAKQLNCPDYFTVSPSSVQFVGFTVTNDESSRRRLSEVLAQFR
jgi:hypothetical protein